MDPDVHDRFRIAAIFRVLSIFRMTAIFLAASMARENAAGSCEQSDNAHQPRVLHGMPEKLRISRSGASVR
jgi:hypothetical protein